MFGALVYLRIASFRNMALSRVRRLRQPKYLFGALAGAAYFYFFFFRRMSAGAGAAGFPSVTGLAIVVGAGLAFIAGVVRIAMAWIGPAENPGLRFTEAEIAFLFPAPISRRSLIHFRLLSSQIGILVASVIVALVTNRFRFGGGLALMRIAGWWVMFSIFELHLNGAALTLARVKEKGGSVPAWRLAAAAVLGLYVAALIGALYACGHTPEPAELAGIDAIRRYGEGIFASGPLPWLVLPFRVVTGPLVASGFHEFAAAILPAMMVAAAHYLWVARTETSFEEGSIAIAEKRAAAQAAAETFGEAQPQAGRPPSAEAPARAAREPFPLGSRGRPEVAFLWKNILSIQSFLFTPRVRRVVLGIVFLLLIGIRSALAGSVRSGNVDMSPVVLGISGLVAFYTLLLGPQFARQDLRGDLPNADILKTYPLAGWQVALGELLAPAAILTTLLWLTILVPALVLGKGAVPWLTPGLRAACALCLAAIAPVLCLIQLLAPNLLMILFPGWYQASRTRGGGIEAIGQRLIFVFAQLLAGIVAVAPAALAAALVAFASQWILGSVAAVILATLAILAVLGGEAAVGIWVLGHRFERFDLSLEFKP